MQTVTAVAGSGQHPGMATVQPRLARAAMDFEAQMMKELLQPLTADSSLTGEDGEEGSNGALGEFASEALGRALSAGGGFGIAQRIVRDLSQTGNSSLTAKVIGNQHVDTGLNVHE